MINRLRLDSTNDLSKVKDWINQVYAEVCVETEANQTSTTLTLTAGTASYTLSSSIIRIKEMFVTPVGSVQTLPLQQTNLDQILRYRAGSSNVSVSNGSVSHYSLSGLSQLEFWPTPGNADVVTIYSVALPTALSGNTDVPILQEPWNSSLLSDGACALAADFKSDPQQSFYQASYEQGKQRFRAHLARRQGNQVQQLGLYGAMPVRPHDPSTDLGY